MTYCEQTDLNIFSLHLDIEQIQLLHKKLEGTSDSKLKLLLRDISNNSNPMPKAGFERRRSIKLCHKCSGSGKIQIGDSHIFDVDDCPVCQGEGHIAEITVVYFEKLTPTSITNLHDDKL